MAAFVVMCSKECQNGETEYFSKRSMQFHSPSEFSKSPEKPRRRSLVLGGLLFIFFIVSGMWALGSDGESEEGHGAENQAEEVKEVVPEVLPEIVVKHTIVEGDIPAEIFREYGKLDANAVAELLTASEPVYDFTKLRMGREIQFVFREDRLQKIRYPFDTESAIIAQVVGDTFETKKEAIPYEVREVTAEIRIDEFLYKDALDAGLTEASILEIADIFSFDIDFTTEIREGDTLKLIYEQRFLDGKSGPDGQILAAVFTNAGEQYFAYFFETNDEGSHYDSEGKELARQFLRAPLSYRAITSGYTGARMHPITKKVTAHYQIDYAAPTGTPVVATARGTVVSARFEGGWGNMIRLKHDNGYTTHYGHLSGYAKGLASLATVSQGQVIGYVGSTGWSTGPHLDYGMKLDGNPINPLSLKLPKGIALEGEQAERFRTLKAEYDERLK